VKVSGERTFDAPISTVWSVLNDPSRMAKTMPGVESFEVADDDHWSANVKVPLGLGGLRMKIAMEVLERREPEYSKLNAKGQGVGAMMNMVTQFNLAAEGSKTKMDWEADVSIAGPVGSMGQRVLQPIVNQQVGNVLSALDAQVRDAAGTGGKAPAGAEEGIHPAAPEAYSSDPEGPTPSTEEP
jgi:carbon monoxide dehydrogenase subunit G